MERTILLMEKQQRFELLAREEWAAFKNKSEESYVKLRSEQLMLHECHKGLTEPQGTIVTWICYLQVFIVLSRL